MKTRIMGVINLTPDSFSDGGAFLDPGAAVDQAHRLVQDGAEVLDLGAESSRPGAAAVPEAEEWRRLEPVLARLAREKLPAVLSVDTRKTALMLRAADLGATCVNDITGGAPASILARLAAYPKMQYIAMHMHGDFGTMQRSPLPPRQALADVAAFFASRVRALTEAGFSAERIWVDPGLGFGKTDAANVQLMRCVGAWTKTYQVAVGVSRKSLIGRTLGLEKPQDRDGPSKMLELGLAMLGAGLIRTHEVKRLRRLLDLLHEEG